MHQHPMHRRHFLGACAMAIVALPMVALLAGCGFLDFAPFATAKTTVSEVFHTGPAPEVIVETFNGPIDVSVGQSDEVVVEVTKHAGGFDQRSAEANLDLVEVLLIQKDNTIRVSAKRRERFQGSAGAAVVVAVPAASAVQLHSSNGPIVCEGLSGGIKAASSNGRIEIVDAQGEIDATTSNGSIEIEATQATVVARTSNGKIRYSGTLAGKNQQFRTSNGGIELRLPADSQFEFDCSTSNANIHCDFPFAAAGISHRGRLQGTVGDHPAGSIAATTSNGPIRLRKIEAAP